MNMIRESSSGQRIIACDFDGTITAGNSFPYTGKPNMNVVNALLEEKENGSKLILWTCRTNDDRGPYLDDAIEFCTQLGIEFDAINEDLPENQGWQKSRKIYATEYWDDRAVHVNDVEFVSRRDTLSSSSWILDEWKTPKTIRNWGWYRVLDDKQGYKVKELVIEPGKSLSMQRHFHRSEHWYVLKGTCIIKTDGSAGIQSQELKELSRGYCIDAETWHQGINESNNFCHILEVQYGEKCVEDDIERLE